MTTMLYGNVVAKAMKEGLKKQVEAIVAKGQRRPNLVVVLVGDDPASKTYVAAKARQCEEVGFVSTVFHIEPDCTEDELVREIEGISLDPEVDGILVQLPLPSHINEQRIIEAIDPKKDVDGLHPLNVGYLEINQPRFVPCTPKGIMTLLAYYKVELEGKRALVIGRSRLVGKPVASLLLAKNATVTMAHSRTKNLSSLIKEHDIVIVAIGRKEMLGVDDFAPHQVVIDVGIHRDESGLSGDVDKRVKETVAAISPVPKGVGPMTIVSLLENTLEAYRRGYEASL